MRSISNNIRCFTLTQLLRFYTLNLRLCCLKDGGKLIINDKNETGLENGELKDLINKYLITWETDNGITGFIRPADPEIINPLIVSLNNSLILKESLNAHNILFRYSDNEDDNEDKRVIVAERNAGNPEYQITDELMQWIQDFNADKKVSPITCFIEHRGVDIFTGVNALNGTVGIVE